MSASRDVRLFAQLAHLIVQGAYLGINIVVKSSRRCFRLQNRIKY